MEGNLHEAWKRPTIILVAGNRDAFLESVACRVLDVGLTTAGAIVGFATLDKEPTVDAYRADFIVAVPSISPNQLIAWLTEGLTRKTVLLTGTGFGKESPEAAILERAGIRWVFWNRDAEYETIVPGQPAQWTHNLRLKLLSIAEAEFARQHDGRDMAPTLVAQWRRLLKV